MQIRHREASYLDIYSTDIRFDAVNDHPPIRATRVEVHIDHVPDSGPLCTHVTVKVTGEKLHGTEGSYSTSDPGTRAYGLAEEPIRYNLCRHAVLDALERHGIDTSCVDGFAFLEPWEEYAQSLDEGTADLSGTVSHSEE